MGLSYVLLQFAGHEFAWLQWLKDGAIAGEPHKIVQFHAFLSKALKVYMAIALAVFLLIWPAGIIFFHKAANGHGVIWQGPWLFLCAATALNILTLPFLSIIEGSGRVAEINRFKTLQNTWAQPSCGWQ